MAQDFISAILGEQPDLSSALSPSQMQQLRSNSALNAAIGAIVPLLSLSGPQARPVGTGQALGAALGGAFGGYNQGFDRTLQQIVAGQQLEEIARKRQARTRYSDLLKAAETKQNIPMSTEKGSQLEMLTRPEFGGGMADQETVSALRQNLPTTLDPIKANAAALQFLADTNPEKYAELTLKQDTLPGDIRSALAYMNLTPEQKQAYETIQNIKSPKTILDMTGGQKGFENEMKLKGEFKSEPVYKAYTEMQSAYGQITDSLKQASPAGDLAAATKFMKLLDPGSVVRESELGMAMAASGLLDRARNYAQMRIDGTKLTDTQRKDFQSLSDQLFATATKSYNSKRSEYVEQGSQYGLNAERALGKPATMPKKNITVDY
jgi:hypothetical protein